MPKTRTAAWNAPTADSMDSPAASARDRIRAEVRQEILTAARDQLAEVGAAALSLRAVAREVGMVSSAVYRYFPSRDELLTALIVEAYDAVADAAEAADAVRARDDFTGRWLEIARAVRTWARAHPHEYALIYGSPVPGYAAPADTIPPASRIGVLLAWVLIDATAAGEVDVAGLAAVPGLVAAGVEDLRPMFGAADERVLVAGLVCWTHLFGAVAFELFGHRHNVVADDAYAAFFDHEMRLLGGLTGLRTFDHD